jgi:hypothetical protein
VFTSHPGRFQFDRFAFLHQLVQFPDGVSAVAKVFQMCHSSSTAKFRLLGNLPFRIVHHFNQFAFLHQFKQFQTYAFYACSSLQSICIPSSLETISNACFIYCRRLSDLTFEFGCRLAVLGPFAFAHCSSLQSICIPPSIQAIPQGCFDHCTNLSKLVFDSGCRISIFGDYAFDCCSSLQSICIPASLRQVTGLAVQESGIDKVIVDDGNPFFRICDDFLIDSRDNVSLIRYLGKGRDVIVCGNVESISAGCFSSCDSVCCVRFASDCHILRFGESAFWNCSSLESICIPSSIETIPESCFRLCKHLLNVTFESGSSISILGESAFYWCSGLQSICLPSSIEPISKYCFKRCYCLSTLTFEFGSRLSILGQSAFRRCASI